MFRILTLLLCLSSVALALPPNSHVVVIGNNFGDPAEVGLRYAQIDARQVAEVLRRLGDVPSQNITTILDADAKTVQASLQRVVSGLGSATVLVVYYSGHADADALHLGGTRLGFDALRQQVREAPAQFRLLVVDACRSGGVSRVKGVKAGRTFKVAVEEDAVANAVEAFVGGDLVQPARGRSPVEAVEALHGPHEDVLGNFLGVRLIAHHLSGATDDMLRVG